jgi:hypothetical protein
MVVAPGNQRRRTDDRAREAPAQQSASFGQRQSDDDRDGDEAEAADAHYGDVGHVDDPDLSGVVRRALADLGGTEPTI